MLLDNLDDRAFSRVVARLAPEIVRNDVELTVIALRRQARPPLLPRRARVLDLRLGPRPTALGIPRIAGALRLARPDVLFAHGNGPSRAAIVARGLSSARTRVVAVEHVHYSSFYTSFHPSRARLRDALTACLYPRADLVAAVSVGAARDLERRFPRLRGRVAVLPSPGIAPGRTTPGVERAPTICSVGNVMRRKGQDVVVRAFALVRETVPEAELVLVGREEEPAYARELRALACDLGLDGCVRFTGYLEDPLPILRAAAVYAHGSRTEGFGMAIVEAMACGTPVVVADCPGGPREILGPERAGIVVPVDDPAALARGLLRVLRDPAERERLSLAGRSRAARYSPEAVARGYLAVARSLA